MLAAGVGALLTLQGNGAQRIARIERTLNDPNPVVARAAGRIRRSNAVPVAFERIVVDARSRPNGRKPKVIVDAAGRGGVIGALDGSRGFALYPLHGRPPAIVAPTGHGDGDEDAQATDLQGDGIQDVVIGGLGGTTYVLQNPRRRGCDDVFRCAWYPQTIGTGRPSHDLVVGDVDRDGLPDVVTEGGIYFHHFDRWAFTGRSIVQRDGEGTSLGDFRGNGILDIVAPYERGTKLARFVNPVHDGHDPATTVWTPEVVDDHPRFSGNMTTAVADIDGDGRADIVMAPMYGGGGLVWYEQPRVAGQPWRRHLIDASVNFVHQGSLQIADFTGDGRPDIAFAEQDQSPTRRVGVFYNLAGDGSAWQCQVLSTAGGHNMKVGYLGRDSRPTILVAPHGALGLANPLIAWRETGGIAKP